MSVAQVRSAAAQGYLRAHGWEPLPVEQPNLLPFGTALGSDDSPTVCVPVLEQARVVPVPWDTFSEWRFSARWAVDTPCGRVCVLV
jgi:hypothetical protein